MKPEKKSQKSSKHTGVRNRLPGQPWRVTTQKGSQDFLDAFCTLDDHGNLYVVRIPLDGSPERTLKVYAPGAWDSFESIGPAVVNDADDDSPSTIP
jgi:hypothetical protein